MLIDPLDWPKGPSLEGRRNQLSSIVTLVSANHRRARTSERANGSAGVMCPEG